jgi:hypothetical protein
MNTTLTNYNRIITLRFNEAVQAGSGTITIKPHGAYFIPPVFENDSYYLNVSTGARSSTIQSGYTRIMGFYDVYNALPAGSVHRTNLTKGNSMTDLTTDARTGQSAGPYIKMTQGLKRGAGYSGNYNNNMTSAQFNHTTYSGPNVDRTNTYMVPDTATKWVLDYQYSINNGTNTQIVPATDNANALGPVDDATVLAIRAALTAAKFRWQELDVTSSSVSINGNTVTITLPEALENGLQWDICYKAGTFTDLAGHAAPAMNYTDNTIVGEDGNYWFISNGVQVPVIRVNRKSSDARVRQWGHVGELATNDATYYSDPPNLTHPGGWGITDFNNVYFRIETETPNATLNYRTIQGNTTNGSAYITTGNGNWTNTAVPGGGGTNLVQNITWSTETATRGDMVRPNLIRRATGTGVTNANAWSVIDENGVTTNRSFAGTHRGLRSYNKDALETDFTGGTLPSSNGSPVSSGTSLYFTYEPTEARKDYVVASASVSYGASTNESRRGYEGVFRSVVALLQEYATNPLYVEGSNVKNGMPSIAGFPVQDAVETGDHRYLKYFYRAGTETVGGITNTRFYWVSTEIVSEWYFLKFANGGRHQESGEVNNYLTAGYGDLTFGYRVTPGGN